MRYLPKAMRRVTLEVAFSPLGQAELGETLALTWIFPGQSLVVGRSKEESDLALQYDGSISKRHFEVSFDGQSCRLSDLGATNGTFVNGQRVSEVELRDGDKIEAGKTRFTLGIIDIPESVEERDIDATWPPPDAESEPRPALPAAPARKPRELAAKEDSGEYSFVTLAVTAGPFLTQQQQELSRQLVWIRAGQSIRVGRSVWEADWVIPADPLMSGLHFEIEFDGRACQLNDLGSSNGTFVNGTRVARAEVRNGDVIRAGETQFELQLS